LIILALDTLGSDSYIEIISSSLTSSSFSSL
jgi:hypothetical protein